jgi:isoamylase
VPMLLGGDELGRTQGGNNNAYCQDNEISWYDWDEVDEDLLAFTQRCIAIRRDHPVLRRRRWFFGQEIRGNVDIEWYRPDGSPMEDEDWDGAPRTLGLYLDGRGIRGRDSRGRPIVDDSFLLVMSAEDGAVEWKLPAMDGEWVVDLDTALPRGIGDDRATAVGTVELVPRSVQLLRFQPADEVSEGDR